MIKEECGVFGIYANERDNVAAAAYHGLYTLQHRGQESCGIVVNHNGVFNYLKGLGLVGDTFDEDKLNALGEGRIAVGHVRYSTTGALTSHNTQPMVVRHIKGPLAVAHNGNLINARELREHYEMQGAIFHSTSDTETIAYAITEHRLKYSSIEEAVAHAVSHLRGAFSLVIMSAKKLILARDPWGFRPLCVGEMPKNGMLQSGGYVAASESCALNSLGAEFLFDVNPGEIVIIDKSGMSRFFAFPEIADNVNTLGSFNLFNIPAAPNTAANTAADTAADTAPNTAADTAPNTAADTAPNTAADTAPNTAADTAPNTAAPRNRASDFITPGKSFAYGGIPARSRNMCVFEYIYFARPDSVIDGVCVHEARIQAGRLLARERPADADIVIGVPDSGIDAALGYSRESGIPYDKGFIKNRYIGRTFIQPSQKERLSSVRLKLNVISNVIAGKRVVMIDDSIVRGTTVGEIVQLLRDGGAREVHVRISSPPFMHPCFFGTDIDSRENLIACKMSEDEIVKYINADSLGYLSTDNVRRIADTGGAVYGGGLCCGCFTGKYPIEVPEELPKDKFESELV